MLGVTALISVSQSNSSHAPGWNGQWIMLRCEGEWDCRLFLAGKRWASSYWFICVRCLRKAGNQRIFLWHLPQSEVLLALQTAWFVSAGPGGSCLCVAARSGTGPGHREPAAGPGLGTVCRALFPCHGGSGGIQCSSSWRRVREPCFALHSWPSTLKSQLKQ